MIDFVNIETAENSKRYYSAVRMDEANDSLVIRPATPVLGVEAVTGFALDVEGDVRTSFRYSADEGLNWSEIMELSEDNLKLISCKKSHWLVIETTITNLSGESIFKSIQYDFEYEIPPIPEFYRDFNYSRYIPYYNHFSIDWTLNVLEKLYKRGIVPRFIERDRNEGWGDEDYINFWYHILYLNALRIWCVDVMNDMLWNPEVLRNWLISKGLEIGTEIHMDELYYLMSHFYDEMMARGSVRCFEKYRELSGDFENAMVRGELARIINRDAGEEFLAAYIPSCLQGWIVGYSSACDYINEDYIESFTKGWEIVPKDLSLYPLFNGNQVSLEDNEIVVSASSSDYSGIGLGIVSGAIEVDYTRDYFFVVRFSCEGIYSLRAGCTIYNEADSEVALRDLDNNPNNYWVDGASYQSTNGDVLFYGEIRSSTSNISYRQWPRTIALKFSDNPTIRKASPFFIISSSSEVRIKEIRLGLLVDKPLYLSSYTEMYAILKNNNPEYNEDSLKALIEQKLLPIGVCLSLDFVNDEAENVLDVSPTEIVIGSDGGTVEGLVNTEYEFEIIES